MNLQSAPLEPAAAPDGKIGRLGDLRNLENTAVKRPR
jgi:hypothetical protein